MKTLLDVILWVHWKDPKFPFYPTYTVHHSIPVPEPYQAGPEVELPAMTWRKRRWPPQEDWL